jgi:hypothetical protein
VAGCGSLASSSNHLHGSISYCIYIAHTSQSSSYGLAHACRGGANANALQAGERRPVRCVEIGAHVTATVKKVPGRCRCRCALRLRVKHHQGRLGRRRRSEHGRPNERWTARAGAARAAGGKPSSWRNERPMWPCTSSRKTKYFYV